MVLDRLARSYTLPYWQVTRARGADGRDGLRNDQIAAQLRCGRDVVSLWRKRFFEQRLAGLEDRPSTGGLRQVHAQVVGPAGRERPADGRRPLHAGIRWRARRLARGICEQISG